MTPRLPRVTKTCPCGQTFEVTDNAKGNAQRHCSRACPKAREAQGSGQRGHSSPASRDERKNYALRYHAPKVERDPTAHVHYWKLDGLSRGTCRDCGETRDFGWRVGA